MADYGAIGAFLSTFGGEMSKQILSEKLRKSREAREDELEEKRYNRQQQQFKEKTYERDADGVLWEVDWNNAGKQMDRRLAPKSKIDDMNHLEQERKLSLDRLAEQIAASKSEREWKETTRPLQQELLRAQIADERASAGQRSLAGEAALIRANRTGSGGANSGDVANRSMSDMASVLTTNYKALIEEYIEAGNLSRSEVEDVAAHSIRAARERRQDAGIVFRDALGRLARGNQAKKASKK